MIGSRLPRSFYGRSVIEVARDLLGRVLVRDLPDGTRLAVRLVETEAYRQDDAASHSFGGRTPRNATMFGSPGHLYVYFTYGMHHCMNAVTGSPEGASAVLLRAAEPLRGIDEMRLRRGGRDLLELCRGPARLCQALGIDRALDGSDLVRGGPVWIGTGSPARSVVTTPRIGIRRDAERPWRFVDASSRFVSGPVRR
ncbi:MAG: DNA-3-methyladenine glycosylase [Actinomycetota bacterium]